MAKFHGFIGFSTEQMTAPGVWEAIESEVEYTGDFLRDVRQWTEAANVNDNLTLSSRVSIIADPFALENIAAIKYVKWEGVKWTVLSVEHQRPRLLLRLGEVYNG